MSETIQPKSLAGQLLVAMPQLQEARFTHAVILVCGHDKKGAMGLVVNKLLDTLTLKDLLNQLSIDSPSMVEDHPIYFGGPVEMGRGFVLHSTDYMHDGSVSINDHVALTATVDILQEIAQGQGPKRCKMALGYVGWSAGQLEAEIQDNSWLLVEADMTLLFHLMGEDCWRAAIHKLGIEPDLLSIEAGHA